MTRGKTAGRINPCRLPLWAAMLGGLVMLPAAAWGQSNQCDDGTKVRISGIVKDIYPNKAGGWSIIVGNMRSPCKFIANLLAIEGRPPSACQTGATVTASVLVDADDFMGLAAIGPVSDLVCR